MASLITAEEELMKAFSVLIFPPNFQFKIFSISKPVQI